LLWCALFVSSAKSGGKIGKLLRQAGKKQHGPHALQAGAGTVEGEGRREERCEFDELMMTTVAQACVKFLADKVSFP